LDIHCPPQAGLPAAAAFFLRGSMRRKGEAIAVPWYDALFIAAKSKRCRKNLRLQTVAYSFCK
jgi:hypothetical protein